MSNPLHDAARAYTAAAIRGGLLTSQPCEVCGERVVEAHHDDYLKPLEVRWLCETHHREHHRLHGFAARGPGRPTRGPEPSAKRVELRLTEQERARWQRAADRRGLTLSQWLREAAEKALDT